MILRQRPPVKKRKLQLLQSTTRCRVRLLRPVFEPVGVASGAPKYLAFAFEDQPDLRGFR